MFDELPKEIQALARKRYKLFQENPTHHSFRLHELKDMKRGHHESGSISVSVNMQYRAIYVVNGNINLWYWIGTHAQYNHFTGKN
ncbi:MAG: hypothetical protein K8U57_34010 [Planctomycetes bacterium]|nr:hypothetical protein [Planctomycetota bacterium]